MKCNNNNEIIKIIVIWKIMKIMWKKKIIIM